MTQNNIDIERGKKVIEIEARAISDLKNKIGENFAKAIEIIFNCSGRIIITGMGKSGLIARKIVATMNSTGTPSIFLHPTDAIHGDLGMVRKEDVVILISKSGDTEELRPLVSTFKLINVKIISIVGKIKSYLATESDVYLDASVEEEACPHNLAPTSSTTVALALGDALAIVLLEKRDFTPENFAQFHPGGSLGKRLNSTVNEFMLKGNDLPVVKENVSLKDAIIEITSKRLGATCVTNVDGKICGIITDGDLRRLLQDRSDIKNLLAKDVMKNNPKTINVKTLSVIALEEMETFKITQLIVVDELQNPVGMIHLHDLVKAGLETE